VFYGRDLAHVHDDGFGGFARDAAPGLLRLLARAGVRRGLVVDLGCGSGIWARILLDAGYDVLGVDASEELLRIARRRAPAARFVHGSLDDVELPRCAAVTALGEVLSYGERASLVPVLTRIAGALEPGGVLAFDLVGPGREPRPRRSWTEGDGWVVCVDAREEGRRLTRRIVTFRELDGEAGRSWRRTEETHVQRTFSRDEVLAALAEAGLEGRARRPYGRGHPAFVARRPADV
jgi:SAM-dependent methyltransferase